MKYIFLAIFVLISTQPVQVMSCDMHNSQKMSHGVSHVMDHDSGKSMDCCDHDPSMPPDRCDSMFHCGAGTTAVLAFNTLAANTTFKPVSRLYLHDTGEPLNRFGPPPFKPPIS